MQRNLGAGRRPNPTPINSILAKETAEGAVNPVAGRSWAAPVSDFIAAATPEMTLAALPSQAGAPIEVLIVVAASAFNEVGADALVPTIVEPATREAECEPEGSGKVKKNRRRAIMARRGGRGR